MIIAGALSLIFWSIISRQTIYWLHISILFQVAQYLCVREPHPPTPCSNLIWSWHEQRLKLERTLANSGQPSEPAGDEIYLICDFFLWAKNGMNHELLSILSLLVGWNLQLQYLDLIQWWIFILSQSFIQASRNHELWYDMKVTHCIAPSRTLFSGRGQMRRPGFIFSYAPYIGSGGEKSHIKAWCWMEVKKTYLVYKWST